MKLSFNRIGLLLKRKFIESGKSYIFGIAIGLGIVFAFKCLDLVGGQIDVASFNGAALTAYLILGVVLTTLAFKEINKPDTGYQFMTLPATTLEKYATTWFFTFVVYSVFAFIGIALVNLIIYTMSFMNVTVVGDFMQGERQLEAFVSYFFANALFLAGAAAFKRNAFFKTLLFVFVIFFFFGMYFVFLPKVFGLGQVANSGMSIDFSNSQLSVHSTSLNQLSSMVFYLTAVVLLIVGFFKFKEREL